jgi:hypothetical protein
MMSIDCPRREVPDELAHAKNAMKTRTEKLKALG